jgi:hypothetical protein
MFQRRDYFWLIFWACVGAAILSYVIFGPRKTVERHSLDCSPLVSIDGTKELHVFDDGMVVLWDETVKDERGRTLPVEGRWDLDETTKLYAVTLNGAVTMYSLVMPRVGPCMLVKGDLGAADLRASWFSKF